MVLQASVKTKANNGNSKPSTTRRPNKMESRVPPRPSAQAHIHANATDAANTVNSIGMEEFWKSKKISCNAVMVLQIRQYAYVCFYASTQGTEGISTF